MIRTTRPNSCRFRTALPVCLALWVLFALLSGAFSPALAGKGKGKRKQRQELTDWIDGPIRYIAVGREIKTFKDLKTDEERVLFIERFWRRRDPSADTLMNEYRQLFWDRVSYSNNTFLDSPRSGWMTDRGKIYILYGAPNDIEDYENLDTRTSATTGRGLIRWLYDGRPGGQTAMNPTIVVPFTPDNGGEYHVSYDPKLSSVFINTDAIEERRDVEFDRYMKFLAPPTRSTLSVMLDLGRMQEVPPQDQVILEQIETIESYEAYPLSVAVHRFVHPKDGRIVAIVTVDVTDTGTSVQPALIARFSPLDATQPSRILGEGSFKHLSHDGRRYAQARVRLQPGEYALTVMVADAANIRTGLHRRQIRIVAPGDRLSFSDIVWSETLDSLPYAVMASYDEAFIIGTFRVLPRVKEHFVPGETLRLFYEVYGGTMPLRITYTLQGRDLDNSWVDLGPATTEEQFSNLQGWEIPTSERWPLGEYRVRIEVLDADERLIIRLQEFELAAPQETDDTEEAEAVLSIRETTP